MTTQTKKPVDIYSCCGELVGLPHADDCPACRQIAENDAEMRAYLDSTPDAWENIHGRG
jgi:hypothetical protein